MFPGYVQALQIWSYSSSGALSVCKFVSDLKQFDPILSKSLNILIIRATWPLTEGACHLPPVLSYLGEQILPFPLPPSSKDEKPYSKDEQFTKINQNHFINPNPR